MKKGFPKDKYGWLRGTPYINKNGKKLVIIYAILVILFMVFSIMLCDNPLLILVLCLANVFFASGKSNELYKTLINERAKLNDLDENDFVGKNGIEKTSLCILWPVVIYFINYTILNYSFFSVVTIFAESRHLPVWWYILIFVVGVSIYHLGSYIGRNITSISDSEPDILAVEYEAIEEREKRLALEGKTRKYKDFIEIDKDWKKIITIDLIWFIFSGICSVVWIMSDLNLIGHS